MLTSKKMAEISTFRNIRQTYDFIPIVIAPSATFYYMSVGYSYISYNGKSANTRCSKA
ncbi:MAG: hypothetical protein MJZ24_08355 [Paludibacteraceae bacterium]|nr:hypothetical protein [Paludibacteraceae bacterium]